MDSFLLSVYAIVEMLKENSNIRLSPTKRISGFGVTAVVRCNPIYIVKFWEYSNNYVFFYSI